MADDQEEFTAGPSTNSFEWDESFFERCRIVKNGWGQAPPSGNSQEASRAPLNRGQSGNASYDGPVTSWPTYRAITAKDWELFNDQCIVFSDGVNVAGIEPGWLVCCLCNNKKAVTKDLMQMHIDSTKHKRNYEWKKTAAQFAVPDTSPMSALSSGAPVKSNPNPVILGKGGLTERDEAILENNYCELGPDGWIICTICDKKCMDMNFVHAHIESTRHKSRMEWSSPAVQAANIDSEDIPPGIVLTKDGFYCTYCGAAEMSNGQVVQLHVQGPRHQEHISTQKQPVPQQRSSFSGEAEIMAQVPPREGIPFKHLVSPAGEHEPWASEEQPQQNLIPPKELSEISPETRQSTVSEEIIDL